MTRLDRDGWGAGIFFRIYDPEYENVPPFNSKFYTSYGLEHEIAKIPMGKKLKKITILSE